MTLLIPWLRGRETLTLIWLWRSTSFSEKSSSETSASLEKASELKTDKWSAEPRFCRRPASTPPKVKVSSKIGFTLRRTILVLAFCCLSGNRRTLTYGLNVSTSPHRSPVALTTVTTSAEASASYFSDKCSTPWSSDCSTPCPDVLLVSVAPAVSIFIQHSVVFWFQDILITHTLHTAYHRLKIRIIIGSDRAYVTSPTVYY